MCVSLLLPLRRGGGDDEAKEGEGKMRFLRLPIRLVLGQMSRVDLLMLSGSMHTYAVLLNNVWGELLCASPGRGGRGHSVGKGRSESRIGGM